jgi:formyltetrahydrofolate deformylase
MQIVITAVGPDNRGLADPIIHYVTGQGANIAEIQMYDHDQERLFAMLLRVDMERDGFDRTRDAMRQIGEMKRLAIRVWSPDLRATRPRLALCTTMRPETPRAVLDAIRSEKIAAEPALMLGNRPHCRVLAEEYGIPWHMIGDDQGRPNEDELVRLCDEHDIDYLVLARYMRVLPAATCWKFAGGRIINLHHGLLPSFPGLRPYQDAYAARMLTYGATCHYIVPELDEGGQIIYQSTYTVAPGTKLDEIVRRGEQENEPHCLVEGVRRVVACEVQLHFHRVVVPRGLGG